MREKRTFFETGLIRRFHDKRQPRKKHDSSNVGQSNAPLGKAETESSGCIGDGWQGEQG
jgi:hypothetical protein